MTGTVEGMATHKTKVGNLELTQVSTTEWRVEAADLRVNGKLCLLETSVVTLTPSGWSMYISSRLRRYDGGRVSAKAQQKVETIIEQLIDAQIDDPLLAAKHRWELTIKELEGHRQRYQRQVDVYVEQIRQAACQLRAHELPGAQGEVARVIVREGWQRTPDELQETVEMLA